MSSLQSNLGVSESVVLTDTTHAWIMWPEILEGELLGQRKHQPLVGNFAYFGPGTKRKKEVILGGKRGSCLYF